MLSSPVGTNRYAYAGNDPINKSDPNGHQVGDDPGMDPGFDTGPSDTGVTGGDTPGIGHNSGPMGVDQTMPDTIPEPDPMLGLARVGAPVGALTAGVLVLSTEPTQSIEADALGSLAPEWKNPDGSTKWPGNNGFAEDPQIETLGVDTMVDRYGDEAGKFLAPLGTPFEQRGLPPGYELKTRNVYTVTRSFDVLAGRSAGWFGQPGGGIQYYTNDSIETLVDEGFLKRVNP